MVELAVFHFAFPSVPALWFWVLLWAFVAEFATWEKFTSKFIRASLFWVIESALITVLTIREIFTNGVFRM